jgi:NNP family nitrate/nitrite transporter-like MFS transporter
MLCIGVVVSLSTVVIGFAEGSLLVAGVFLQPMLVSSFFPAAFASLARTTTRENFNVAISIIVPVSFLFGGGIVPSLMGVLGDHTGFAPGFVILGAVFLGCLSLLAALRLPAVGTANESD